MARDLDNIDCPKCKNDLKVSALKCPTCGAEFTKAEADARTKEHWRSLGTGCLFLIFIAAALWWAFLKGDDKKVVEQQDAATVSVAESPPAPATPDRYYVCAQAMESINAAVKRNDLRSAYTYAHKADLECSAGIIDAQPNIPQDCSDAVAQGHMFFGGLAESFDIGAIPFSKQDELASYRRTFDESVTKCNAILNPVAH